VILYPNRTAAVRTFLIDRQAIRVFKERDERWSSMIGQRLPTHDLVNFTFNLIARHGFASNLMVTLTDGSSQNVAVIASRGGLSWHGHESVSNSGFGSCGDGRVGRSSG
jgi:hypothetical protein